MGMAWAASLYAWGVVFVVVLLLAPLGVGYMAHLLVDGLPAAVALGGGVAAAYALGLTPWNADDGWALPLACAGTALSWAGWNVRIGAAGPGVLLVALAVTVVAWGVRAGAARRVRRASQPASGRGSR